MGVLGAREDTPRCIAANGAEKVSCPELNGMFDLPSSLEITTENTKPVLSYNFYCLM